MSKKKAEGIGTVNIIMISIFSVLIGSLLLLFISMGIEMETQETMRFESSTCEDRDGDVINGVTCTDEIKCGVISRWIAEDYCYGEFGE